MHDGEDDEYGLQSGGYAVFSILLHGILHFSRVPSRNGLYGV